MPTTVELPLDEAPPAAPASRRRRTGSASASAGSWLVAAEPLQGELVQGLRSLEDGYIPPIIDLALLDRKIFVSNRDSVVWTKRLLDEEGIFVGVSSGAIASIAVRVANQLDEGNVVFVAPDDGWKYLSSGVYSKTIEQLEAEGALETGSFW